MDLLKSQSWQMKRVTVQPHVCGSLFVQFPQLLVAVGRKDLSDVTNCLEPGRQWLRPLSERSYEKAGWDEARRILAPRRGKGAGSRCDHTLETSSEKSLPQAQRRSRGTQAEAVTTNIRKHPKKVKR